MPNTLSAKEVAKMAGTDAKRLRRFIRSDSSGITACGQGNRYEFTQAQARKLVAAFNKANSPKQDEATASPKQDEATDAGDNA